MAGEEQEGEEKEVEEEEEDEGGDGVAGRGYDSDSNDIEATEIRHGDSFAASFYIKSGALGESYIDIDVDEDWEEETSPFQPYLSENQDLPSSDNPQEVLE